MENTNSFYELAKQLDTLTLELQQLRTKSTEVEGHRSAVIKKFTQLLSPSKPSRAAPVAGIRDRVVAFLGDGRTYGVRAIAEGAGVSVSSLYDTLHQLVKAGTLARPSKGAYALARVEQEPLSAQERI